LSGPALRLSQNGTLGSKDGRFSFMSLSTSPRNAASL
jgi:hypothetical protein